MAFGGQAIVIGGSMAGLVAARVLADHFERVTVLERDTFPTSPEPRKGVPQGLHLHVLLLRGREALEELFPGFDDDLAAAGAPLIDWTSDARWRNAAGWVSSFKSGLYARTCSRPLIDWHLQRRLAANPRVSFCEGADVIRLETTPDGAAVRGVRLRWRDRPGLPEESLPADLVVDASGRSSHAADWLESLGYGRPPETVVNPFVGYASRQFPMPADPGRDWKLLMITATPPQNPRLGILFPIEGGRWIAGLGGSGRVYPPGDEAGWWEFASNLPDPLYCETIKGLEPLSPIFVYRRTENHFRHYERLSRWPEQFVVLGDAACAFNPIYGQGMTNATVSALLLDECLRRQPGQLAGLGKEFQRRLGKQNQAVWTLATGEDYRYPTTEGPKPGRLVHVMHRYLDQALLEATHNPRLMVLIIEVLHLVRPASALLQPAVAARILPRMISARKT